MYKITNIETLGTDYTVTNKEGKILKNIRIIPHTEILEASMGIYNEETDDIQTYLENSVAVLEGNENIKPYSVYWHMTASTEVVLTEIIEYAIKNGYDIIILEYVDPT